MLQHLRRTTRAAGRQLSPALLILSIVVSLGGPLAHAEAGGQPLITNHPQAASAGPVVAPALAGAQYRSNGALPPPPGGLLPLPPSGQPASGGQPAVLQLPSNSILEYPVPTAGAGPNVVTLGPDSDVWFTEYSVGKVAHITTSGQVTEYTPPTGTTAAGITTGPDHNLWFAEESANNVGRLTTGGSFSEYRAPTASSEPLDIAAGPDGNLWFTEQECCTGNHGQIGMSTPSGQITEFALPHSGAEPQGITAGPDGNLWFAEYGLNSIGRITPSGTVKEFTAAGGPDGITAGPDGNLWFTEYLSGRIGRLTPKGTLTEFTLPTSNSGPTGITTGRDGNLWFTEYAANQIGEITPSGTITEYALPSPNSGPNTIVARPDGNLWFSEYSANKIGVFLVPTSGAVPWHPHYSVRLSDHLSATVDLADGHVDVHANAMAIPALGSDLAVNSTWDSALARAGTTTSAGAGWVSDLTPSMGGTLTGAVTYTDSTGATWDFPYTGNSSDTGALTKYNSPPGLSWQLATLTTARRASDVMYTLTNVLTGEVLTFNPSGQLLEDTDSYGNNNQLLPNGPAPTSYTNSGGRSLTLAYQSGLLSDVQSPYWRSSGGTNGQHVTYSYGGTNCSAQQLCALTRAAGTSQALTDSFGYTGNLLTSVTTPMGHA